MKRPSWRHATEFWIWLGLWAVIAIVTLLLVPLSDLEVIFVVIGSMLVAFGLVLAARKTCPRVH